MNSLIVFAKEPEKGRVKTRLKNGLRFYKAFLKDILATVREVKADSKILAYDCAREEPKFLKKVGGDLLLYKQTGRNLGERMHNAFQCAQSLGGRRIVIIGSDSPTLPAGLINQAFQSLSRVDVVLGPAIDGGFYLIGLKAPDKRIFSQVKWSSSGALNTTLNNIKRLRKKVKLLDVWYDVDDEEGLAALKAELKKRTNKVAQWTRKLLKI